jgi:hypothetical protein
MHHIHTVPALCTYIELFGVRLDIVGVYCVVDRQEARCVTPTRHELRKSDTLNAPESSSPALLVF